MKKYELWITLKVFYVGQKSMNVYVHKSPCNENRSLLCRNFPSEETVSHSSMLTGITLTWSWRTCWIPLGLWDGSLWHCHRAIDEETLFSVSVQHHGRKTLGKYGTVKPTAKREKNSLIILEWIMMKPSQVMNDFYNKRPFILIMCNGRSSITGYR